MYKSTIPAVAVLIACGVTVVLTLLARPAIKRTKKQRSEELEASVKKRMTLTCVLPSWAVRIQSDGADVCSFICQSMTFEDAPRELNAANTVR